MKYIKFVLSFLLMIMVMKSVSMFHTRPKATDMENVAKRNFLFKAREYLHSKPLSRDLRSFIRRVRKKTDSKKREVDKDHMYVVQNGDIIPLKDLASVTNSGESTGDFTVIPLIIPVTVRTYNETAIGNTTNAENGGSEEEGREEESVGSEINTNEEVKQNEENNGESMKEGEKDTRESSENGTETTTTKEKMFLDKVMNDFQDLIALEREGQHSNEGIKCSVLGDWDSDAAGMQIRIEPGDGPHNLAVSLVEQEPPKEGGMFCNGEWDMYGMEPFNHSSLIVITAVSRTNKKLASFIGECRECEDAQTIVGNWMEGRCAKNCKDRLGAHTFFADVFKRNNVRTLQHAHLQEITTTGSSGSPGSPGSNSADATTKSST